MVHTSVFGIQMTLDNSNCHRTTKKVQVTKSSTACIIGSFTVISFDLTRVRDIEDSSYQANEILHFVNQPELIFTFHVTNEN